MTKKTFSQILGCSVLAMMPVLANAAGTYYVGNYQSPQQNYSQMGYASQRQNPGMGYGYGMQRQNMNYTQDMTYSRTRTRVTQNPDVYVGEQYAGYRNTANTEMTQKKTMTTTVTEKPAAGQKGFWLSPALSHEYASWRFDMKDAGSILHYDNIRWNVLDVTGGYRFDAGNTPLQIDAGLKYGAQFGDSTMVDDDITNGGYEITVWQNWDDINGNEQIDSGELTYMGPQIGHSLSVGTTNGGSMLGFNLGLGLTDFFKAGNVRFTPSVGYRYFKYKLETKQTHGMTVDTLFCNTVGGTDETQCDPFVSLYLGQNNGGNVVISGEHVLGAQNEYGYYEVDENNQSGIVGVSTGGTYMFILPGVSHSYEVEWAGPYLALDMIYDINERNAITGRVELGLPAYTASGDQPYRADWVHPTSVKDEGGIGDAWHFGMGANYMTAITDTVSFTMGVTFDYYTVSGASASTFFNQSYYMNIYNDLLQQYTSSTIFDTVAEAEDAMLHGYTYDGRDYDANPTAVNIDEMRKAGWVSKVDSEIESVYKSLGLRIGINAKF